MNTEITGGNSDATSPGTNPGGYIYLATPYSDDIEIVRTARFWAACAIAGRLMRGGLNVFSPIAHGHPIALVTELPTDFGYWRAYCDAMLSGAAELWVAMMPGWQNSVGIKGETDRAQELGLHVVYYCPFEEDLEIGAVRAQGVLA